MFRLVIGYLFPSCLNGGEDAPTEGADLAISLGCTSPVQPKSDSSDDAIDVEKGEELLKSPANNNSDENRNPNCQAWQPYQHQLCRQTSHYSGVVGATSNAAVASATAKAEDRNTTDALVVLGERVNGTGTKRDVSAQHLGRPQKPPIVECSFNKEHVLCFKCPSNEEIRLRISKYNEGTNRLIFEGFASVKVDPTTGQLAVTTNLGYWSVINITLLKVLQSNNCSVQFMGIEATEPASYVVQFLPSDQTERTKKVARSLCSKFIEELNAVAETA